MDGATFKRPPPASSRHRVIIKVLPWKVPVGYGDVAPEEVKQWVESVEVSMPLTRFCARIKHTFENDLHHGKGSLKIRYLLNGHGLVVPRDHGTVGDHFDDTRGKYVPEDCTAVVEREPPSLEELRALGSMRFASIAPEPRIPAKRPRESDCGPSYGSGSWLEREGSVASNGPRKRRATEPWRPKGLVDPDEPLTSREGENGINGEGASDITANNAFVAVADSQRCEQPSRLRTLQNTHNTLIPDSHAQVHHGARNSREAAEDRSESPKSESPEPGSVIKNIPPARGFSPGTQLQLANPSREGSVQLLNRVEIAQNAPDENASSLESPPPDAQSPLRTPTHANLDHPATRTSNPRSLSKGSRSKTSLQHSSKDIFAVPSDIDSTQDWQPLGVKLRNPARAPLRKLGGPKFKPLGAQRDSESAAQQASEVAEPADEAVNEEDGGGSSYDISVPVGERNLRDTSTKRPSGAEQTKSPTKQPRRLGDIIAGRPDEPTVNDTIDDQDDADSEPAISKASTKVNEHGSKSTSVVETDGSKADEDAQMEDALAIDDAAASSQSDAADASDSSDTSERSSGDDVELPVQARKESVTTIASTKRANGTTLAQSEASKVQLADSSKGKSMPIDQNLQPKKSVEPRSDERATWSKSSKDAKIEKLSEEIRQQREMTSELSNKSGLVTPGKKSITAPIPKNAASVSKRVSTNGSVTKSSRETPSRTPLPEPGARPSTKLSAVSTRRSVSFADETPARKSPSPAPFKAREAGSEHANGNAEGSPTATETKPSTKKRKFSAPPAKQSKVNDFRAALFASVRPPIAEPAVQKAADPVAPKPATFGGKRKKAIATKTVPVDVPAAEAKTNGKVAEAGSDSGEKEEHPVRKRTRNKPDMKAKTEPPVRKRKISPSTEQQGSAKRKPKAKGGSTVSLDTKDQSKRNETSAKPIASDQSNSEAKTDVRDATRSRSPAKAVETSTEGDLEGSSESGSEADRPEKENMKGKVPKGSQDPQTRQQGSSLQPKAGREKDTKNAKRDAATTAPVAKAVSISSSETSSDEETEEEETTSATSKSLTEKHPEAGGSSESKSGTESELSSESDEETVPPPKTAPVKSKKPKAFSGSSEEDAAAKQLREEASQSKQKSSQGPKPSLPTPNSSQMAKALQVNPNPSSSFGGAPKFSELSKQTFVTAPVQHRMPGNPAYKMPTKPQTACKPMLPEDSEDSEDTASSDEGGPDQLWQRIWSQHL